MNWKNYLLSTVIVLIVARGMVAFLFFGVVFDFVFDQPMIGARAEEEELHLPAMLAMLTWSLAFVYIFNRGFENKGLSEGVRFGVITFLFYFVPMIVCYWSYFALPVEWVYASLTSGLAESLTAGLSVAIVYKTKTINRL